MQQSKAVIIDEKFLASRFIKASSLHTYLSSWLGPKNVSVFLLAARAKLWSTTALLLTVRG